MSYIKELKAIDNSIYEIESRKFAIEEELRERAHEEYQKLSMWTKLFSGDTAKEKIEQKYSIERGAIDARIQLGKDDPDDYPGRVKTSFSHDDTEILKRKQIDNLKELATVEQKQGELLTEVFKNRENAVQLLPVILEPDQLGKNGHLIRFAPPELLADKEFITAAYKVNSDILQYASAQLRNDKDIVKLAESRPYSYAPTSQEVDFRIGKQYHPIPQSSKPLVEVQRKEQKPEHLTKRSAQQISKPSQKLEKGRKSKSIRF